MIFLIVYDRPSGRIVTLQEFEYSARPLAEETRLQAELELGRGMASREVVILEAANISALRETHRRYFETLEQLAARACDGPPPQYPSVEPQ
ncbi:MAG: hypothetical protein HZA53_14570 [Planctomycetes bacterium]|nr:hypothetical protein [Planctomycetota bacterium]